MWNRLMFVVGLTIAVALMRRVYLSLDAVIGLFPIREGDIVLVDLDFVFWLRAAFVVAHACVAWFVAQMWKGKSTLASKILTLVLLVELVVIYLVTLRFWYGGIPEIRLY
jgi:hypothetical protein